MDADTVDEERGSSKMGKKKKKLKELKKEVKRLTKEVKKLKKETSIDWNLAVERLNESNAGGSNTTVRKVGRKGIWFEGNVYFSEELVLDHYAEQVNVVVEEETLEVQTMDGTSIIVFERIPIRELPEEIHK